MHREIARLKLRKMQWIGILSIGYECLGLVIVKKRRKR